MTHAPRLLSWFSLALALVACEAGAPEPADPVGADGVSAADADAAANPGAAGLPDTDAGPAPVPSADALDGVDTLEGVDAPEEVDDGPPPGPPALLLTVVEAPAVMNGSLPAVFDSGTEAPFVLHVNREDFTLDAMLTPGSGPAWWDTLAVACDLDLMTPDGLPLPADTLFGVDVLEEGGGGAWRRLHVTAANPAPHNMAITCQATLEGPGGEASSALTFVTEDLPPHLDPFVEPDVWLVVLSRDIFEIHAEPKDSGGWWVWSDHVPAGDGVLDFDEAFMLMGLFSPDAPAAMATVKSWLLAVIRQHAHDIFGLDDAGAPTAEGVPLQLYFEGDAGAPPADVWDGSFSRIALGGDGTPEDQENNIVGRATVDWNNQGHEDDAEYGLGVYPSGIVRQVLGNPLGALLLEQLMPMTGDPIGTLPIDEVILAPDFDPETYADLDAVDRYTILRFAVEMGGLAVASTLCHEMGHSLGLVPYGLPPDGLFAGLPGLTFLDNDVPSAHVDTPGLNVMQTGAVTNWVEALEDDPRFNAVNMAYLRRRLIVK